MAEPKSARVLPHDIDAEQALLGAVLLAPSVLADVADTLRYHEFYRPSHQRIYETIVDMSGWGMEIDPISVKSELEKQGYLEQVGGAMYLLDLQDKCTSPSSAKHYAAIVREKALFRRLVEIGVNLEVMGYEASLTSEEAMSKATNAVFGLSAAHNSTTLPIGTALDDLLAQLRLGRQDFISPPMLPWVHIKSKELVVIGAGSSVGKTAFAINLADHWARETRVAFFEYEMSESELVARLVSKYTGITAEEMDNGLNPDQLVAVERAMSSLSHRNFYIEAVTCDIAGLMAKVRREAQRGAKVVFIDHLGLIPFTIPKGVNHAKAVGQEVTNKLKRLAMELDVVIVLLSQIGREGAKKWGVIPSKEDLRDSGEIEQDADKVIMLGREALMEDDSNAHVKMRQDKGFDPFASDAKEFTLIGIGVRKYRNGALGEIWQRFYGSEMKYTNLHPMVGFAASTTPATATQEQLYAEETGTAESALREPASAA